MAGKGKCRSCGADIIWVKTRNGKNMPVDFDADLGEVAEYDRDRMTSHFDTCKAEGAQTGLKYPKAAASIGPRVAKPVTPEPEPEISVDDINWEE